MTLKHRRTFTRELKLQVLAEIAAGKSIAQAAREHQLHPTLIGRWQKQHRQYAGRAFAGNGRFASAIKLAQKRDWFEQLSSCKRRLYKQGLLELSGRYDKL